MWSISLLLCAILFVTRFSHVGAQETNVTGPIAAPFFSRPDLDSITLNVTLHNDSFISPGYIFLAPYQVENPGPYLFDNTGGLVWSGYSSAGPQNSHDFRVCTYNGTDHLCMYQGNQELGYAHGHGLIMDNSYNIIKSVQTGGGLAAADQHEFNTNPSDGKTALMTIYNPIQYDLTAYNVTGGQGWILQCYFQEVDVDTSEVLFEWASLDYVQPSAGYVLPNTTDVSGDGTTKDTAWDYFHINSIDKNAEGDYLISGRHTEAIYKISGENGSILWQLGGKTSDFQQSGYNFSYQHDARFVSENSTTTVISLFNNAYNGFNGSANFSEGKVVAINNSTMTSDQVIAYGAPDPSGGLLSASQGNLQFLPNGNVFLGWGSNAYISESTSDGTPVLYAYFATTGALHYRAYKFNFTGIPSTTPALYTYALNTSSSTAFYVSWNGATEVASWTFYGGSTKDSLMQIGNVARNGFETVSTQSTFYAYSMAEAVANNGSGIGNSSVMSTFVPGAALAAACTDIQCPMIGGYQIEPDIRAMTSAPIAASASATNAPTGTLGVASSPVSDKSAGNRNYAMRLMYLWIIAAMAVTWLY